MIMGMKTQVKLYHEHYTTIKTDIKCNKNEVSPKKNPIFSRKVFFLYDLYLSKVTNKMKTIKMLN